jgi:DNA-binding MurR/RpiR family transcriptional regulator
LTTLADRIAAASSEFTPADRRIDEILFSTNMLAGLETVARLGERARVSGPTVLRFVTKLGFSSFPEFQEALRSDIESRLASPLDLYAQPGRDPDPDSLAAHAAETFDAGVRRTLARLEPAVLDKVVEILADPSRTIYLVGGRFTHHLAEIFWGHLHQLRPRTRVIRQGVVSPRDHLVDIGRRDVLVVFDLRRYQADTVELAEFVKLRRATVILITDPLLSPIARVANHVLTCELDAPSPYDSMVPCLALVEVLVAAVMRACGDDARQRIVEIEQLRELGSSESIPPGE